jgi:hypothetical protein
MWFNLAAAGGDKDAVISRDRIAAQMTPAQVAKAQKLAREWKPKSTPLSAVMPTLLTIDLESKAVTVTSVLHADLAFCSREPPRTFGP